MQVSGVCIFVRRAIAALSYPHAPLRGVRRRGTDTEEHDMKLHVSGTVARITAYTLRGSCEAATGKRIFTFTQGLDCTRTNGSATRRSLSPRLNDTGGDGRQSECGNQPCDGNSPDDDDDYRTT